MSGLFPELTVRLRALMVASAPGMIDRDGVLVAPWDNPARKGEPMWFGQVREGKAYVSYHLMPVYSHAALAAKISPALRKRMQGKSCFNFKVADEDLFEELAALTREGAAIYAAPFEIVR
jgi:hypothetical protein